MEPGNRSCTNTSPRPRNRQSVSNRSITIVSANPAAVHAANAGCAAIAAMYNATPGEAASFTRGDNVPGLGALNPAIGAAFGLPANRVSGVIAADDRLFVIQKTLHVPADSAAWEAQKTQQRTGVLQALADQKWQRYMQALKDGAEIVDNRRELARRAAQQQSMPQQTPVNPY